MLQTARDVRAATAAWAHRNAWLGWVGWAAFLMVALARTHPRRFASTFSYYLDAAQRLSAHQQVYDPHKLGEFLYLPLTLLLYVPFTWIDRLPAAAIAMSIGAALFTYGCVVLLRALMPEGARGSDALALAGIPLVLNIPAVWFNIKGVQAQIPMTGAMLAACAAMAHARWRAASIWLLSAVTMKPLALVMLLLCGALVRETRWILALGLVVLVLAPFAFLDWSYLIAQYQDLGLKLWNIATAPSEEWPYQADMATMLRGIGISPPSSLLLALRLAAALGTLALAWHVRRAGTDRAFAFAVLMLSGCYITLFSPRNEFLSFVVLTPALTVLTGLILARDGTDQRAWLLIAATLLLGFSISLAVDAVLKPAIVVVIYLWVAWSMVVPERWRALIEGDPPLGR
jgi:Glycosyltransferase family 87